LLVDLIGSKHSLQLVIAYSDEVAMSATPVLSPESRPGSRRDQILDAAMQCFASAGFRGTTTREIASRVGLTEAALYRHFASKEALYSAIIARKIDAPELASSLEAAAAAGDDRAVFGGLARTLIERVEADPAFIRILLFTALEGHSLAEPFFAARVLRLREFLTRYIERRIREGAFRALDPVIAARAFLGMVSDYMNVRVVFRQQASYPQPSGEVVETFVSIFLAGISTPSGDER
jgi:AcrR family transcriptional regulator